MIEVFRLAPVDARGGSRAPERRAGSLYIPSRTQAMAGQGNRHRACRRKDAEPWLGNRAGHTCRDNRASGPAASAAPRPVPPRLSKPI